MQVFFPPTECRCSEMERYEDRISRGFILFFPFSHGIVSSLRENFQRNHRQRNTCVAKNMETCLKTEIRGSWKMACARIDDVQFRLSEHPLYARPYPEI